MKMQNDLIALALTLPEKQIPMKQNFATVTSSLHTSVFFSINQRPNPVSDGHHHLQTDGLSDNVFPSEMISICGLVARTAGSEEEHVQTMANRIVDYARQCMAKKRRVSPFESMSMTYLWRSRD